MLLTATDLNIPYSAEVLDQLNNAPDNAWDHLDNPFENKYILHKDAYTQHMHYMLQDLKMKVSILWKLDNTTGYYIGSTDHWDAILAYKDSGYLLPHLDANTHPLTKLHKVATALLYLGYEQKHLVGGDLLIYDTYGNVHMRVPASHCTLVIFTGDPTHAVEPTYNTRYALTVSFVSSEKLPIEQQRERAYFMPWPGTKFTPEQERLRDLRADPVRYAEAYKT